MARLLTAVLLFVSFNVVAEECPPFLPAPNAPTKCDLNQLNNDEVADADEVMENFNKLGDAIDIATPSSFCRIDQIMKWDGSAWACSSPSVYTKYFGDNGGEILCPAGKKVTGGGCTYSSLDDCTDVENRPRLDLGGWTCVAYNSYGVGLCEVNLGYAICQ